MVICAPGGTVMGWPKFMLAIVMVAALAAAGAFVASAVPVALAVMVAVPVLPCWLVLLDPPHAVATAATRHIAAQNKPNLFIFTPLGPAPGKDTIVEANWFNDAPVRCLLIAQWITAPRRGCPL